ncbi:MAG: TetR/AcrR family transcriptional regulator [Bacteroidota bacterium]
MPRTKTFNEQVVLEKAMHLFWAKGYHATSIQDLVSHLGVNRASLYGTFGGKHELFEKSLQHYRALNGLAFEQFLAQEEDVKEGLRTLFRRAIQEAKEDSTQKGCFFVNTTTELIPNDPKICACVQENRQYVERVFEQFLQKGIKNGQLSPNHNTKASATFLFTFYSGLRVLTKTSFEETHLYQVIDEMIERLA